MRERKPRHGLAVYRRKVRSIDDRVSRIWTCIAAGLGSPFVRGYLDDLRRWDGRTLTDVRGLLDLSHYTTAALIEYAPDPPDLDEFKSLEWIRQEAAESRDGKGRGDCGTYTAVEETMHGAWGWRVGCRVIAQSQNYDHVFGMSEVPGLGVVFTDASVRPTPRPGWNPPRSRYWTHRDFWLDNLDEWVVWFYSGADESRMPRV